MLQANGARHQLLLEETENIARNVTVTSQANSAEIVTDLEFWTWFAFQCTVMIIGGIGNTWAFASIILNEKLQNTANTLFAIQAANDAILLLFSLPITIGCTAAYRSGAFVPDWMCSIDVYIRLAFASASPLGQSYTAVNQFMAVFWPLKYRLFFGRRRRALLTCVCGVWGFAATYQLLQLFHIVGYSYRLPEQGICVWILGNKRFEDATAFIFTILPLTIMIGCYIMIFIKLRTTKDALLRRSVAHRAEGSLMMFASSMSYLATILPGTIYLNLLYDGEEAPKEAVLILWSFTLIYVNFALNPVGLLEVPDDGRIWFYRTQIGGVSTFTVVQVFYAVLNRRIRQSMKCCLYIFLHSTNLGRLARLCSIFNVTPALLDSNSFPSSKHFRLLRDQSQRASQGEQQIGVAARNHLKSLRQTSSPPSLLQDRGGSFDGAEPFPHQEADHGNVLQHISSAL